MHNRVALITDTHFGFRKGNQTFHDYFEKFYQTTFFTELEARGITNVIHLGDCFDVRKGIDYWSLDWAKRVFFDELQKRGIELQLIVGNHDIFYKNTLRINSPGLNLCEYDNVHVRSNPGTVRVQGVPLFFVPWICEDNAPLFLDELRKSQAKVALGHLELAGFYANQNYQCMHGTDPSVFAKFDRVFSGHFHKRSTRGNITYLGNSYQMMWNDVDEKRGFAIFDLDTHELELIDNPFTMFHKLYYNESKPKLINYNRYKDAFVKVIVEDKSTPKLLNHLVDQLYRVGVNDVNVIENMDITLEDEEEIEAEDTLTTLTNYVNAMEGNVSDNNKQNIIDIFKSLYIEAQEV